MSMLRENLDWLLSQASRNWQLIAVAVGLVALVTLYGAIRLAGKVFAVRRQLGTLGAGGKLAFYGSLIYAIFPIDLLPDPIYLDDMAVLGTGLLYLTKLLRERQRLPGVARARAATARKLSGQRTA
jgi:hypothetical protein